MKVRISAEVDIEGATDAPPIIIVVGNPGPLVAHYGGAVSVPAPELVQRASPFAPPVSRAPEAVTPANVLPWQAKEEDRAAFFADAPDVGQHDTWKREAAVVAWRFLAGAEVSLARGWFDLDGRSPAPQPLLFPFALDLVSAFHRLGFLRIMIAALGLTPESARTPCAAADLPAGGAFALLRGTVAQGVRVPEVAAPLDVPAFLRALLDAHDQAVTEWIERVKSEWDLDVSAGRRSGAYDVAAARRMYALAPPDVDAWERPDLAGLPALNPITLSPIPATRTPSTGAPLP